MINSYSFGCMEINNKPYRKDLMILPDKTILHPWWRKAGHTLSLPDIQEIIAAALDILVIGTGSPGMMQPEQTLCRELESRGIEIEVMPTKEAAEKYNTLHEQGRKVAACFHLTC
ncbi:MAG: Mth938-like domain-containing protein [Candidatus Electrothrix sp. YB6]